MTNKLYFLFKLLLPEKIFALVTTYILPKFGVENKSKTLFINLGPAWVLGIQLGTWCMLGKHLVYAGQAPTIEYMSSPICT